MTLAQPKVFSNQTRLALIALLALIFIVYGFAVTGIRASFEGLVTILTVRDMLMTDYMAVGGIGGAFLNGGLLLLSAVAFFWGSKATVGGSSIACLFLVLGFALFGKSILNIWPILGGVFLFTRFKKEPFAAHLTTAFFGCALSPVVSEIFFSTELDRMISIPLAIATGLLMGFVLPPVAGQLFKAHEGHNLYNMGFTAGMVGTIIVSVYIFVGFIPEPVFLWEISATPLLAPFLITLFFGMIGLGAILDPNCSAAVRALHRQSGQAPSDFSAQFGDAAVLVNMGLLGLCSTLYVLAIDSPLNGPTIGAILSVMGFGAFGKHLFNCAPIVAGVALMAWFNGADPAQSGLVLAALFSTSLAPIAGRFGWHWGILAGAIHAAVAQSVGVLHAGLNLYNNGFAAGIVATLVSAVILSVTAPPKD